MADTVKCTVIGDREINGVPKGGTVELDPDETNIDALVSGGHIELSKTAAKQLTTPHG